MVVVYPRLILFMAALTAALMILVRHYDPRRAHGRVLRCCTAGLMLLLVWNALSLPHVGVNPLSAWAAGVLGIPGAGMLAVLAKLP